jgi:hypothetical protein
MIKTEFMKLLEDLDRINEATDINASKKFWAAAKNKQIDAESFHAAFDDELTELGLMDLFTDDGTFTDKSVYGKIKDAKILNPDSWAVKALSKLWTLRYVDHIYFNDAEKAEEEKRKKEEAEWRAEREKNRAAQFAKEEEERRLAKEATFKECQELVKSYINKVDPAIISEFEEVAGTSVVDDIYLELEEGRGFKLCFKKWERCYPRLTEGDIRDEARMIGRIENGLTGYVLDTRLKKRNEQFKTIDMVAHYTSRSVRLVLLGESGTLYEVDYLRDARPLSPEKEFTITVNGKKLGTTETITEPWKVIFAYTYEDDGNYRATRDSVSDYYYSWDSRYADKLNGYIPVEFKRKEGYLDSYSDTRRTDGKNNGYSIRYSHEDGIDSWATHHVVSGATE